MKNYKIVYSKIQAYLKKNKFFVIKIKKLNSKKNDLDSLPRTLIASLIIILAFSISPIIVKFNNENSSFSKDFENNSKNDFKKLLENQDLLVDNIVEEK